MVTCVFAVWDVTAGFFSPPFVQQNKAMAMRSFEMAANDPATMIAKFPAQFQLFQLGTFDDSTGDFERDHKFFSKGRPVYLCTASEFVRNPQPVQGSPVVREPGSKEFWADGSKT